MRWGIVLTLAVLLPVWTALASDAGGAPQADDPQKNVEEQTDAMVEELGRALGMAPAEIEALGLSPAEMRSLLAGFTEETVVVGSRAQPRSATASAVPVDVLSARDLVRLGTGDLKAQLRTIIPSFNTNTQPIQGASTVVRPAMLRNLAPDHVLVLINVAAYGDIEVTDTEDAWTLGGAIRAENFEDFGTTTNGKVSGRFGFVRGSVSSGFRAPTPGQQNGFNISSWFDPTVGDLINNAVIPSISPAARLRGGLPLGPEQSVNYTAGTVFDTGSFTLTADYFRIDVSDRIGITSNFYLTDTEIADLVAGGFDAAESVRNFRFFTNAFDTSSQGVDVVTTYFAARAPREHRHQRRFQPHGYPGDRQRQGSARRPAARRVRLRPAAHTLERRRDVARRRGQPARPRRLLQRLV